MSSRPMGIEDFVIVTIVRNEFTGRHLRLTQTDILNLAEIALAVHNDGYLCDSLEIDSDKRDRLFEKIIEFGSEVIK